ncbi:ribose-5-phosphate isomerase RpiA [Acetilactobacillus jinshanensis]|uniref:Ribose-5-phosphate isomerase A n=1 Tax=Acetilactobacillus jinshanensis TaxID=1720083 RepID=A0A4P6ZMA8_9LACO|nr:ribose-5-phosphate isomerase RpiA [Acetilactobacillus jinshanensis]QBP18858.1 ribose-5-phosphate isomerase RpiA [Acetilactobacillus jinshanensis]URL61725.1 ribose-5-phosphate isomerase RpiA [uncultured bacterium]
MNQDALKQIAAREAVKFVKDDMVVGLGTGSTVKYMIQALGKRLREKNLHIVGIPTSNRTARRARRAGIPIKNIDDIDHIDLTIDGADQVDKNYQGIKGGGIAHLWEKIVAINSTKNIWIVDETKLTNHLGSFPLPLEVIPYGSSQLFVRLKKMGYHPTFRMSHGRHILTHSRNYIIDLNLGQIDHPHHLSKQLDEMTGIVEHGLFLDIVNTVIVGHPDGPEIINAR